MNRFSFQIVRNGEAPAGRYEFKVDTTIRPHSNKEMATMNDHLTSKGRRRTVAAVICATVGATAMIGTGIAFADAGSCISSRICTSYVTINGTIPGNANTTYRFDTNDDDLRNNDYGNGSDVDNDTPSVRNTESFNRACGYLNPVGQTGNVKIWSVTSAANGFVPVDARTSSLRRYFGSGAVPSASTCPASL